MQLKHISPLFDPKRLKSRMAECPLRRGQGCGLVDIALGWEHGMAMDECDQCWSRGGGTTPEGRKWLEQYGGVVIQNTKRRLVHYPLGFIQNLLQKYCTPAEKRHFLETHGYALGVEGSGALARELGLDPVPYEDAAREISAAMNAKPGYLRTAVAWLRSKTSAMGGTRRVPLTIKGKRHVSCFGQTMAGEVVQDPCKYLQTGRDGYHYCGKCRCGQSEDARLDGEGSNKLDHPYLECPIGADGFSNEGAPYAD